MTVPLPRRRGRPPKPADPDHVITLARAWLGTPYHDQACLKGVGCDCLGLARGIWRDLHGLEPFPIPPYRHQSTARHVLPGSAQTLWQPDRPTHQDSHGNG